jgi:hypothetical protein
MMKAQCATGGYLPEKNVLGDGGEGEGVEELLKETEEDKDGEERRRRLRRTTMGNWMLDAVAELTRPAPVAVEEKHGSRFLSPDAFSSKAPATPIASRNARRPSSIHVEHLPQAPGAYGATERFWRAEA